MLEQKKRYKMRMKIADENTVIEEMQNLVSLVITTVKDHNLCKILKENIPIEITPFRPRTGKM